MAIDVKRVWKNALEKGGKYAADFHKRMSEHPSKKVRGEYNHFVTHERPDLHPNQGLSGKQASIQAKKTPEQRRDAEKQSSQPYGAVRPTALSVGGGSGGGGNRAPEHGTAKIYTDDEKRKFAQERGLKVVEPLSPEEAAKEKRKQLIASKFKKIQSGQKYDVPTAGLRQTTIDDVPDYLPRGKNYGLGEEKEPSVTGYATGQRDWGPRNGRQKQGMNEMDNRSPSGDRREQRANSPEAIAQREKELQADLKKVSPEMRKKLRLPEPKKQAVAEGNNDTVYPNAQNSTRRMREEAEQIDETFHGDVKRAIISAGAKHHSSENQIGARVHWFTGSSVAAAQKAVEKIPGYKPKSVSIEKNPEGLIVAVVHKNALSRAGLDQGPRRSGGPGSPYSIREEAEQSINEVSHATYHNIIAAAEKAHNEKRKGEVKRILWDADTALLSMKDFKRTPDPKVKAKHDKLKKLYKEEAEQINEAEPKDQPNDFAVRHSVTNKPIGRVYRSKRHKAHGGGIEWVSLHYKYPQETERNGKMSRGSGALGLEFGHGNNKEAAIANVHSEHNKWVAGKFSKGKVPKSMLTQVNEEAEQIDESHNWDKLVKMHLKDAKNPNNTIKQRKHAESMASRASEASKIADPQKAYRHYMGVGVGYNNANEEVEQDETMEKVEMAQTQLHFIAYAADEILEYIEKDGEIEEWYQNKLSKVHSDMESLFSYVEGEKRRTGMVAEAAKWRQGYRASGHPPGYQHKSGEVGPLGGTYDTFRHISGEVVKVPVNRYRNQIDVLANRGKTKLSTRGKPLTAKNAQQNLKNAIRRAKTDGPRRGGEHGPVGVLPEQSVAEKAIANNSGYKKTKLEEALERIREAQRTPDVNTDPTYEETPPFTPTGERSPGTPKENMRRTAKAARAALRDRYPKNPVGESRVVQKTVLPDEKDRPKTGETRRSGKTPKQETDDAKYAQRT